MGYNIFLTHFVAFRISGWNLKYVFSLSWALVLSLGCYGEQQGGGACSGSDGRWQRGRGQVMCGMRRSNRRPLSAVLHGAVLAHAMPQVLVLPRSARRVQQHLLQQRRHDPLQEWLHQVSPVFKSVRIYASQSLLIETGFSLQSGKVR